MSILSTLLAAYLFQSVSMSGSVTNSGTHEPITKATIQLRDIDGGGKVEYAVTSKSDGTFALGNIKPGKYRIAVNHQGFVSMEYGQRKVNGPGMAVEFVEGQSVSSFQLQMTPTGAISGHIYDVTGQPIIKATVQVMKPTYQNGKRTLNMIQSTVTNDLGEYRLFWLAPGQYYVSSNVPNWNIAGDQITMNSAAPIGGGGGSRFSTPPFDPLAAVRFPTADTADNGRYQAIYFPNSTDDQAAQAITVPPGGTVSGTDMVIGPVRTRHVRGVVIDADTGAPLKTGQQPSQIVSYPQTTALSSNTFADRVTGEFETQVVQGAAIVGAIYAGRGGRISLSPGESDIEGLRILLKNGITLNGQIRIDGAPQSAADSRMSSLRMSLTLEPQMIFTAGAQGSGMPNGMGIFTIPQVQTGDYHININPILSYSTQTANIPAPLQKLYLKSIHQGDKDITDQLLHVEDDANLPLTIQLGADSGVLDGLASDANQTPAPGAVVAVVPNNRNRFDFYRSASADSMGRFHVDRIPPGDYTVFCWSDVDSGAWQDPQFLRLYEDRGTALHIDANATATLNVLTIVP